MENVTLGNGIKMPLAGMGGFMGIYKDHGDSLYEKIKAAYEHGCRLIDTSVSYGTEAIIGDAMKKIGVPRSEWFICTKIGNREQETNDVFARFEEALLRLQTDYIDCYLIHWPLPNYYLKTWKGIEKLYKEGKVRVIGVANCHQHHLESVFEMAEIAPMVNQVEIHPLFQNKPLCDFCKEKNIKMMAYTPLGRMHELIANNEEIKIMCRKHSKTVSQIVLRWHYQKRFIAIPSAMNVEQTIENLNILDFELTESEMNRINEMNCNLRIRYDPDNCDFSQL